MTDLTSAYHGTAPTPFAMARVRTCTGTTSGLTSADHDAIWDIMNNFDFDKVHRVMTVLDWRWALADSEHTAVPDIQQIRDTARNMLTECTSRARKVSGQFTIGSGGLYAHAEYEPSNGKVYQKLAFELTNWDNYE